jgi:hypothetical protein
MMKFKLLLWMLTKLMQRAVKKNPKCAAYVNDKNVTFQIQTVSGEGRYFEVKNGKINSYSGLAKAPQKASTIAREAFFIDFAEKVRKLVKTPLMVTGGFRTVEGMNQALRSQACDVIGIARIMAIEPDVPKLLLAGKNGLQSVHPIKTGIKKVDSLGVMEVLWYTQQLKRMGKAKEPKPNESGLWAFIKSILRSGWGTYATQRARAK